MKKPARATRRPATPRALRAEIKEAAWATFHCGDSPPFDPPATGKITIKVINHRGDEALKVLSPLM